MTSATTTSTTASNSSTVRNHRAYQPHRQGYGDQQHNRKWDEKVDSPLLFDDDDDDDWLLQKIVHNSCQAGGCGQGDGALSCHMAEQLDLLTHCRQPLAFLSLFQENRHHPHDVVLAPAGAYGMPEGCEYCGETDTQQCRHDDKNSNKQCRRPAFYFQKKRPPFCPPDATQWDPVTDHAIPVQAAAVRPPAPSSPFEGSWVSGLFRGGSGGGNASTASERS